MDEYFDEDTKLRMSTALYSLCFYLTLIGLINLFKVDAKILSLSKDEKVRKEAYAKTREGKKRRVYMDSTIQSMLSSIFSALSAFHLLYVHRDWRNYPGEKLLFDPDAYTFFYCSIMAGYFASDLILEMVYWNCFDEFGMIIHHVIFLFCCVHNLKNKVFTFQFIWLSLCECSTPFVNLRWVLHVLGLKDSKIYLYNGFCLTMTFFFFRVVVYTLGLYHLYTLYPMLLASDKPFASKFVVPSCLVMGYVLNLLWASKIIRGLYSLLTKKSSKKKAK